MRCCRACAKKGDLQTAKQLMGVMRAQGVPVRLGTELALIEGMVGGGAAWPAVERELVAFVDADSRTRVATR